jgi:hypothetical protein
MEGGKWGEDMRWERCAEVRFALFRPSRKDSRATRLYSRVPILQVETLITSICNSILEPSSLFTNSQTPTNAN